MATETDLFVQPPPKRTGFAQKWADFRAFLWNSNTREFMGRNGCSWAQIGLFYLVFYSCLAAFFAVMLVIFYETLDRRQPKFTLDKSAIGTNPGLGFRPQPEEKESSLIWVKIGNESNWNYWANELNKTLERYEEGFQFPDTLTSCQQGQKLGEDVKYKQVCHFDLKAQLGKTCIKENYFGYREGQPCVLLKLNKIYGWEPTTYKSVDELPSEYINLRGKEFSQDFILVSCEGENPADKENIGQLDYFPNFGFPIEYFPYYNVPGYLSPVVMVYFKEPKRGVLISVECKAWAKNIKHNRQLRMGSIRFELMVD